MSKRKLMLLSCPMYLFLYMGDCLVTSYYSLYFIEKGASEAEQSILLGLIPLALTLGCLLMSPLAKSRARSLWLFRLCLLAEMGISIAYGFVSSFPALLALSIGIGFCNGAPFNFVEGYLIPLLKEKKAKFSFVRVFGTIGYLSSLIMGYFLLKVFPIAHCYFYAAGFFLLCVAVSFFFKANISLEEDSENKQQKPDENQKKPFWTKKLVAVLLSILLVFGSYNAFSYLFPIRLYELGVTSSEYSLFRAIGLVVEMAVMLMFPFLPSRYKNDDKKHNEVRILFGGILCMASCLVGIFLTNGIALAIVSFSLASAGKALFFGCLSMFLISYVDSDHLGKALSVNGAGMNLGTAALNATSSTIYTSLGFASLFGIIAGLQIVGLFLFVFVTASPMKRKGKGNKGNVGNHGDDL